MSEQRLTRTSTYVEPKMLSKEHIAKMQAGRLKAFEKKRAEKGLDPIPESSPMKGGPPVVPELPREEVIKQINKAKKEILHAQIESAKGMSFTQDGKTIYTKAPDRASGEYLLNQLIGKPTESLEIKQITKIQVDI